MIPYLICAVSMPLCTYIALKATQTIRLRMPQKIYNFNMHKVIFLSLAMFFPCYFAAVRDVTIGRDVLVYGELFFHRARTLDLTSYMLSDSGEILYRLLVLLLSKTNRYIYYFVIQLLSILPVCITLQRPETERYSWLGMLIYILWIYTFSLNIMRQSISISIILWGTKYIKKREFKKYFITILIAMGFHLTSIVAFTNYFLALLISESNNEKNKNNSLVRKTQIPIVKFIIVACGGIIVINVPKIINLSGRLILNYSLQSTYMHEFDLDLFNLLLMTIICVVLFYASRKTDDKYLRFIVFIIAFGGILYQMVAFASQMYRISLYFTSWIIIGVPEILFKSKIKSSKKKLIICILIIILGMNFYHYNIYLKWHSVYPYTSAYLGLQ